MSKHLMPKGYINAYFACQHWHVDGHFGEWTEEVHEEADILNLTCTDYMKQRYS